MNLGRRGGMEKPPHKLRKTRDERQESDGPQEPERARDMLEKVIAAEKLAFRRNDLQSRRRGVLSFPQLHLLPGVDGVKEAGNAHLAPVVAVSRRDRMAAVSTALESMTQL